MTRSPFIAPFIERRSMKTSGSSAAAEDGAVAVGMHADLAGVIRRELEQRVALAADGDDDAVLLQLIDGALDLLARGVGRRRAAPRSL